MMSAMNYGRYTSEMRSVLAEYGEKQHGEKRNKKKQDKNQQLNMGRRLTNKYATAGDYQYVRMKW